MPETTLTPELKRILAEALALPDDQRSLLLDPLIASIDGFTPEVRVKWIEEVDSRIAAMDAGELETVPADEVFRELREELRRSRERRGTASTATRRAT
jgi:hypothetical protein